MWLHPRHRRWAYWYHKYMQVILFVAATIVFIQAATIRSTDNVSIPAFILWVIVSLSWFAYGILWHEAVWALSGGLATAGSIWALVKAVSLKPPTTPGAFAAW